MTNKKDFFTDIIELKFTIPEDELHPVTGDPLPHKVIISRRAHDDPKGPQEKVILETSSFTEAHPDRKPEFMLRVMSVVLNQIKSVSLKKKLKLKYLKEMEDYLWEMKKQVEEEEEGED